MDQAANEKQCFVDTLTLNKTLRLGYKYIVYNTGALFTYYNNSEVMVRVALLLWAHIGQK